MKTSREHYIWGLQYSFDCIDRRRVPAGDSLSRLHAQRPTLLGPSVPPSFCPSRALLHPHGIPWPCLWCVYLSSPPPPLTRLRQAPRLRTGTQKTLFSVALAPRRCASRLSVRPGYCALGATRRLTRLCGRSGTDKKSLRPTDPAAQPPPTIYRLLRPTTPSAQPLPPPNRSLRPTAPSAQPVPPLNHFLRPTTLSAQPTRPRNHLPPFTASPDQPLPPPNHSFRPTTPSA